MKPKDLISKCSNCDGMGKIVWHGHLQTCRQCNGTKVCAPPCIVCDSMLSCKDECKSFKDYTNYGTPVEAWNKYCEVNA